jgi:catechol 2,3-dioxygenase-like lactoylglutathione lyase family enzyme
MQVVGVDHLYITVADFERSLAWYDRVMALLGFRKGDRAIGGDPHAHYFNPVLQLSIRPARNSRQHDPYSPGLHHLCFQVPDRDAVDEVHAALVGEGVSATEPALYPEYNDDYYATFFEDPDGIRLEVVGRSRYRRRTAERWHDLRVFLNPLAELDEREAAQRKESE